MGKWSFALVALFIGGLLLAGFAAGSRPPCDTVTVTTTTTVTVTTGTTTTPTPTPPTNYVDDGVYIAASNYRLDNFTLRDQRYTSDGTAGLVIKQNPGDCVVNDEVSNFDIGPTADNGILIYTHECGGHYIHDGKIHEVATPPAHTWGTHGIYDTARDTKVVNVESFNHPDHPAAAFSIRQPNQYAQDTVHDAYSGVGITDYSTSGQTYNLVLRELLGYNIHRVMIQMDGVHYQPSSDACVGDCLETWGIEVDHATLDLRGMSPDWYAAPIDLSDTHHHSYITNSVIIWDGPAGNWLAPPYNGAGVDLTGTVVLTSAQASQYLDAGYHPLRVFGSPLIGQASSLVPPRTAALGYIPMSDVGRFQAL